MSRYELVRKAGGYLINKLKPTSEWTPNPRPPDDTSILQEHRNWFQLQIVLLICRFTPTCPEVIRILSLGMEKELPLLTRVIAARPFSHVFLLPAIHGAAQIHATCCA